MSVDPRKPFASDPDLSERVAKRLAHRVDLRVAQSTRYVGYDIPGPYGHHVNIPFELADLRGEPVWATTIWVDDSAGGELQSRIYLQGVPEDASDAELLAAYEEESAKRRKGTSKLAQDEDLSEPCENCGRRSEYTRITFADGGEPTDMWLCKTCKQPENADRAIQMAMGLRRNQLDMGLRKWWDGSPSKDASRTAQAEGLKEGDRVEYQSKFDPEDPDNGQQGTVTYVGPDDASVLWDKDGREWEAGKHTLRKIGSRTAQSWARPAPDAHVVCWFLHPGNPKPVTEVTAEVAATPRKRAVGLSQHQALHPAGGMLFLSPSGPRERPETFHMATVPFSLDIVFVRGDGKIGKLVHDAQPGDPSHWSYRRTAAVLEVCGGFCRAHGIGIGDVVKYGEVAKQGRLAGGPMAPVPSGKPAEEGGGEWKEPKQSNGEGEAFQPAEQPDTCQSCGQPTDGGFEVPGEGLLCDDCADEYIGKMEQEGQAKTHDVLRSITEASKKLAGEGDMAASVEAAKAWIERLVDLAQTAKRELDSKGEPGGQLAALIGHINGLRYEDWRDHFFG